MLLRLLDARRSIKVDDVGRIRAAQKFIAGVFNFWCAESNVKI